MLTLDSSTLAEVRRVNREVNKLDYRSDTERFHQDDFWTRIDAEGGDCEDYALEKRARLMALGLPHGALKIAICRVSGAGHAVLTLDANGRTYVLDNNFDDLRDWHSTGYEWLFRQRGKEWVRISS